MVFVRFWRLRKFIRDNTTPIPEGTARTWNDRLSKMYNIGAITCFTLSMYMYLRMEKKEKEELGSLAETKAEYFMRTMNLKDVKVARFDTFGRTILKETIENADDFKAKREQLVPGYGRYDDPKSRAAAEKREALTDQEAGKLAA